MKTFGINQPMKIKLNMFHIASSFSQFFTCMFLLLPPCYCLHQMCQLEVWEQAGKSVNLPDCGDYKHMAAFNKGYNLFPFCL